MKQPDHIDELLKQRLYHAEATPPAFVWPEVEKALRKRRRRFVLWFFAGFAGLTLAGTGILMWSGRTNPDQTPAGTALPKEIPASAAITSSAPGVTADVQTAAEAPYEKVTRRPDPLNVPVQSTSVLQEPGVKDSGRSAEPVPVAEIPAPSPLHSGLLPLSVSWKLPDAGYIPVFPGRTGFPVKRFGPHKNIQKTCYDFDKHTFVWFVDLFAGPSFAVRKLNTNTSDANINYLRQREQTERRDWAFNSGFRGTLMFDQHFMIRTGLQYEQMTEVFELSRPNEINVDITRHWDAASGVWTTDTVGVHYGEKYLRIYNRFGMLDIPLLAGVEIRNGRSGFSFNAGVTFNVLFWKRGAILTPAGVARYFTPGAPNNDEIFQVRTGMSAMGSVQWFYHLQPKLRIFAEPYFRQILSPVNIPGYPVEQRYGIGGIRVGVTKILD